MPQRLPNIERPAPECMGCMHCDIIVYMVDWNVAGLFARALEGVNVKELITNIGSSAGSAPAAGGAAPSAAAVTEEKKGMKHTICVQVYVIIIIHKLVILRSKHTDADGR